MTTRGETVEFTGSGPYELPKCGAQVSALLIDRQYFVLEVQTEERNQQLFVPISVRALPGLKILVDHLQKNVGLGATEH